MGLVPNMILILMVSIALYRRTYEAYAFAFAFGLIIDSLSGGPFGIHTAIFMLTVFAASLFVKEDHSNVTAPLSITVMSVVSLIFYVTFWLTLSFQAKSFALSGIIFTLEQVAITVGFFVITFPLLRKLFEWEEKKADVRMGR